MGIGRIILALWLAVLTPASAQPRPGDAPASSRFDGWASAVIAADWRDSQGQPIEAFDNARRDLAAAFREAGLPAEHMVEASLRPDAAEPADATRTATRFAEAAQRAHQGCFFYITSHGSPEGIVFGPDRVLTPTLAATLLRSACGTRPTIVVLSACFSGVFVDTLSAPNRMILTAARRDRSSFGCGAEATYPYFDGCVIEALKTASDFLALAASARTCVSRRETEEKLEPPSEPQLFVGGQMQLLLPTLRFNRPG